MLTEMSPDGSESAERRGGAPEYRPEQGSVPVIVLGSGLTALGVIRSLADVGIETLLVDGTRNLARRSRWARRRVIEHPESTDPASLLELLERLPYEKAVLLPCSDKWTTAVAGLRQSAPERFATSMPPQEAVSVLADKALLANALDRLEIPHPWTKVITTEIDLDGIPEVRWPDIFLKPTDSQSFSQLFGVKAFTVSDRSDAAAKLQQMHDAGIGAVAQEYIPGPPDRHYFIDGFVDRSGRVKALLSRRRIRMFPTDYGNSTFMHTVPLDFVAEAVAGLERLLADLFYRGIFSAEFKHDPRDDVFRLLEVNVRPWWYIEFATLCGINVAELSYLDALDRPVPNRRSFPTGARHVLMPDDIFAFRHLRRNGSLSFSTWWRQIWGASDAVFRRSDPLPAFDPILVLPRRVLNKLRKVLRSMRS